MQRARRGACSDGAARLPRDPHRDGWDLSDRRRSGGDSVAMALVTTPAIVLQTYRYSETSKVVRLATRDLGVQSAIAKGALRPKSRFGAGLELLSEGTAQLYFRETRELHTLGAFDLINLRRDLAADVDRFAGATALTQVMLKMAPPAPLPVAFDTLAGALDALERAPAGQVDAAAVRALWCLLAVLGFEPSLARCARDGAALDPAADEPVPFSVADGGVSAAPSRAQRSEEHTSELQSLAYLVCRLLLEKKNKSYTTSL